MIILEENFRWHHLEPFASELFMCTLWFCCVWKNDAARAISN